MRYKIAFGVVLLVFSSVSTTLILTPPVSAQQQQQSPSPEKSKERDFGSSLRRKEKERDDKSANIEIKSDNADKDDVVRIETNLVLCDVLVSDQKGTPVIGLKQNDFLVAEDDNPQEIGVFSLGDDATVPRSIVLIIDYSGSQLPYIETSVEAAKILVGKLNPKDKMAIVTDDVELLADFTSDKNLLKEKLDFLKQKALSGKFGRSEQYSALMAVLNEMFKDEDIRPIIIFQTDGDELFVLKQTKRDPSLPRLPALQMRGTTKNFSFEDVYKAVEKSRATIFSIISEDRLIGLTQEEQSAKVQSMSENSIAILSQIRGTKPKKFNISKERMMMYAEWALSRQLALSDVAKLSGGYTDALEKPEQAEGVYSRIFSGINNRYVIGYYPTNTERDGKQRKINIEVRNHPEYVIRGRKSYFAPEPPR